MARTTTIGPFRTTRCSLLGTTTHSSPPPHSEPGPPFRYNNSGYVLLSIAIEAASGRPFAEVVEQEVLAPAGMSDTGFFRSDDLPSRAALG